MNQLLMKYSDGLGGIMLACENVRIKNDGKGEGRGWILNELPWIHYTVSCDALVFRPYLSCQVSYVCRFGKVATAGFGSQNPTYVLHFVASRRCERMFSFPFGFACSQLLQCDGVIG